MITLRFPVFLLAAFVIIDSALSADSRLPVPPPLELAKSENVVKDIYKAEYAKTKAAERSAFAVKLLQQASETRDDPASQYVLFREARDLAAKSADSAIALKAASDMAEVFKIGRGEASAAAADALVASSVTPTAIKATADALQVTAEEVLTTGEWDAAIKLLNAAAAAAQKGVLVAQSTAIRTRIKQVEAIKLEAAKIEEHRFTLRDMPDDPTANAAVGRFQCFVMKDWDGGLPLLAKGNDAKLKDAAAKDIKAAAGTEADQVAAADAWYELAAAVDATNKAAIQTRAHHWYGTALTTLSGLSKAKAESRMKELNAVIEKGSDKSAMWATIRTALIAKKTKKGEIIGGGFTNDTFEEVPPGGAILIGFKYSTQSNGAYPGLVQPIFLTEKGEVNGKIYGTLRKGEKAENPAVTKAKPGYAVGAIYVRGGGGFDAFRPIYMKMTSKGLNPADFYDGPYVGGQGGGAGTVGGDGNFIVGLHGKIRTSDSSIQALSVVTLTTQPPYVKKP